MAVKLTRLTHKIAIQLHLVAESYTTCISRSRRPVRKLLDTPSYLSYHAGRCCGNTAELNSEVAGLNLVELPAILSDSF
jgi:hypothetical protein